jgi:hypothetical protein
MRLFLFLFSKLKYDLLCIKTTKHLKGLHQVVTRLNRSAQTDQNSAERWNILTRGAIQNLSDLHRVEK